MRARVSSRPHIPLMPYWPGPQADLNRRILGSLFVLIATLCIFVGSTQFAKINPTYV